MDTKIQTTRFFPHITCYRCKDKGHYADCCPVPRRRLASNPRAASCKQATEQSPHAGSYSQSNREKSRPLGRVMAVNRKIDTISNHSTHFAPKVKFPNSEAPKAKNFSKRPNENAVFHSGHVTDKGTCDYVFTCTDNELQPNSTHERAHVGIAETGGSYQQPHYVTETFRFDTLLDTPLPIAQEQYRSLHQQSTRKSSLELARENGYFNPSSHVCSRCGYYNHDAANCLVPSALLLSRSDRDQPAQA